MKPPMEKPLNFGIYLPEKHVQWLDWLAEHELGGSSRSSAVRFLIQYYVREEEKKKEKQ